jgi:hypothetical protein
MAQRRRVRVRVADRARREPLRVTQAISGLALGAGMLAHALHVLLVFGPSDFWAPFLNLSVIALLSLPLGVHIACGVARILFRAGKQRTASHSLLTRLQRAAGHILVLLLVACVFIHELALVYAFCALAFVHFALGIRSAMRTLQAASAQEVRAPHPK